jgi:hypothetical protein
VTSLSHICSTQRRAEVLQAADCAILLQLRLPAAQSRMHTGSICVSCFSPTSVMMSSHMGLLANPMLYEYGYCSSARLAQTEQGDKCSLSPSHPPRQANVVGPLAGLGETVQSHTWGAGGRKASFSPFLALPWGHQ